MLGRSLAAQGATQGLQLTLVLSSSEPCRLPARPRVQILLAGRPATVRQVPLRLSSEDVPRRVIGPGRSAVAMLRWSNWCGRRARVSLRLSLGGVSIVDTLGPWPSIAPVCVAPKLPSTLAVSLFVRR